MIENAERPENYGFLLLLNAWTSKERLLSPGPSNDGHTSVVVNEDPVGDESHQRQMLHFLGVFLAKLTVIEGIVPEVDLSRLMCLVHTGPRTVADAAAVSPPSPREEAFIRGFNEVVPQKLLAVTPFASWTLFVEYSRNESLRLTQRKALSNYQAFVELCKLRTSASSGLPDKSSEESMDEADSEKWSPHPTKLLDQISSILMEPTKDDLPLQLRVLTKEAFGGGEFFVKNQEGALTLHSAAPMVDERTHCLALELIGALAGLCIRSSFPVGYAMEARIYECLGSGRAELGLDEEDDPVVRKRFESFLMGVFALAPPLAFTTLPMGEIALLFEWKTQDFESIVGRVFSTPPAHLTFLGVAVVYDRFFQALASMPLATVRKFIKGFRNNMRISPRGFSHASPDAIQLALAIDTHHPVTFLPSKNAIALAPMGSQRDIKTLIYAHLLKRQSLLSFELVQKTLGAEMANRMAILKAFIEMGRVPLEIGVLRESLFMTTMHCYLVARSKGKEMFPGKGPLPWKLTICVFVELMSPALSIKFSKEPGQDMGGLIVEWLTLLLEDMFMPERMIVSLLPGSDHYVLRCSTQNVVSANDPAAPQQEQVEPAQLCEFLGWVLGHAFLARVPTGRRLPPVVYHLMLAEAPDRFDYLEALKEVDREQFDYLNWVLSEANFEHVDFYFEAQDPLTGQKVPLPFDTEERGRPVTEANKEQYVFEMAAHLALRGQDPRLVMALTRGFQSVVDPKLLQAFGFDPDGLRYHMEGRATTIDVSKWRERTVYKGADNVGPEHPVIQWFWELLQEAEEGERQQVLTFATSQTQLPPSWFEEGSDECFTIEMSKALPAWPTPTACTCTSTLTLHPYQSKEDLKHYLWKALELGVRGFGMA